MVHYAQRHPIKVFFLVVLPLITGGVLQKLLSMVGIRMPRSLSGLMGKSGGSSGGYGGSGSSGGGEGLKDSVSGLVSLAKMFI